MVFSLITYFWILCIWFFVLSKEKKKTVLIIEFFFLMSYNRSDLIINEKDDNLEVC